MARLRSRSAASVLVVLALLAAGCTSGVKDSDSSGSKTPSATQPSAWDHVLSEIGPNGQVSKSMALRAFSVAIGPLPGVSLPAGEAGDIRSGSAAVRWLHAHWSEITPAQRAAAVRLVPELGIGPGGTASPASFTQGDAVAKPIHPSSYYLEIAKSKAVLITAALGGEPRLKLDLEVAEGAMQKDTSAAETSVVGADGGRSDTTSRCVIRVGPHGADQDEDIVNNILAHEVWHCFQGQVLGVDAYATYPSWIIEGGAQWVGDTIAPTLSPDRWWEEYLLDPGGRLFSREYDAIGFFAHLDEAKLDTWTRMIPILKKGADNATAFAESGATSDEFLDTWASGFFRQPNYGKAWDMKGPGLPPETAETPLMLAVDNGNEAKFDAPQYANSIAALSSTADVLVFSVDGHVRLADPGTKQEYVVRGTSTFCTKSGGCECPDASFAGVPPTRLSADSVLAASSGPDATSGTVAGESLEEFCKSSRATWHFDSPSRYSGGPSHTVVDAYTCTTLRGPWKATLHVTHSPATSSDPALDRLVNFTWTFDRNGRATPTIGPYNDTVFGTTHAITYFPVIQLDLKTRTIAVLSMEGSEDGSPRINVNYQLGRIRQAVPLESKASPRC
jgi:hypothetical protein